ncbi:hypothetical protein J8273_2748 [Carpediemonas membranifera]|uniref:COMM domain-containing protein n=1 Tax=Carpediemonas membranifera TaxID=201153 RepID=A0A8J6AVI1_9EUKA|nr:hypothetical protein J8273_2748 [Carpediemonas membranifera]|eukprot:KAG9395836.1 hypothetical protein J8273_2748 [Carpediemonas membranifera]
MFFNFCGGDVPDWVLSQFYAFDSISSEVLGALLRETVRALVKKDLKHSLQEKLELDRTQFKSILAVLHFIISSAARYNVKADVLQTELLQLGLQQQQCALIAETHATACESIRETLQATMMRLPSVASVITHVDEMADLATGDVVKEGAVHLSRTDGERISFKTDASQLASIVGDLKGALESMQDLESLTQ